MTLSLSFSRTPSVKRVALGGVSGYGGMGMGVWGWGGLQGRRYNELNNELMRVKVFSLVN